MVNDTPIIFIVFGTPIGCLLGLVYSTEIQKFYAETSGATFLLILALLAVYFFLARIGIKLEIFEASEKGESPDDYINIFYVLVVWTFVYYLLSVFFAKETEYRGIGGALGYILYILTFIGGTPFSLVAVIGCIPHAFVGTIALAAGRLPAAPIVKEHARRRRPSGDLLPQISRALKRHDIPDAELSQLIEELPAWRRPFWNIKAMRRAQQSRRIRKTAYAERKAGEASSDLGYTSAQVERDRRLRYPDHEPLILSCPVRKPLTPERIRALAEKMITDDIKKKAYKLTPEDLNYHAKLREQAEEEVAKL